MNPVWCDDVVSAIYKNRNETNMSNKNVMRCPNCGRSKDPSKPDFMHVRLGLDEAPEPLLCRCKPDNEIISGIMMKNDRMKKYVSGNGKLIGSKIGNVQINPVAVTNMSPNPETEVEARFTPCVSRKMYEMMEEGMFGHATADTIGEMGCSWWTGSNTNRIAKLRMRSNGEKVAKIVMYTCQIMPGIIIAVSYEFEFRGEIVRPEYNTMMDELRIMTSISGTSVTIIARRYNCEDVISYSSEIEFRNGVRYTEIRKVLNTVLMTVGSEDVLAPRTRIDKFIAQMHLDESRHADHDVVDIKDLSAYKGTNMLKADGMKVYVFCYVNGYIITLTDSELTILEYAISLRSKPLFEITDTPDILVAEMMKDGTLVYIDTLALDGNPCDRTRRYSKRPMTRCEIPPMIIRKSWDKFSEMPRNPISSMEHDGIVCVTEFRTVRLKKPTIDLLYKNGFLHMVENRKMIRVAPGHKKMIENSVYEMDVNRSTNPNQVVLTDPTRRLIKRMPNNSDIIKRAFMSVSTDLQMDTILYDITNMSFKMRARTYELAQSTASGSGSRKVIVIFGAGRFQEINEMRTKDFSYIAIDPEIDIETLSRRAKRLTITPYDETASFSRQVMTITNRPGRVLFYRGRSENFIVNADVISGMSRMGIPAIFSFSISYHIRVINTLVDSGVNVYGCGFVHDNMPRVGIKNGPVSMKVVENANKVASVESRFGKSVWLEPILFVNSVPGLHSVRKSFEEVWSSVDSSTYEIMSRAVIMY